MEKWLTCLSVLAILALLVISIGVGILYWRQVERNHDLDAELGTTKSTVTTLRQESAALRDEVTELKRRGNVIYTLGIELSISGVHLETERSGQPEPVGSTQSANLATVATLVTSSGPDYRFTNPRLVASYKNGILTFLYEPENLGMFLARQMDVLKPVRKLRLNYGGVFRAAGVQVDDRVAVNTAVDINGLRIFEIGSRLTRAELMDEPVEIDVGEHFSKIASEYTDALKRQLKR